MNIKNLSVLMIFISASLVSQNINDVLPKFNKKGMATDILYNPAGVSDIGKINDRNSIVLTILGDGYTKNQRDLAKTIIYARENVYSMKKKIGHLEVYRGDSNIIKNKYY